MMPGRTAGRRKNGGNGGLRPTSDPEEVFTSREAREFLKIGRTKLHELTHRKMIPAYRIGDGRTSALRYLRSDLLDWLFRQRVKA